MPFGKQTSGIGSEADPRLMMENKDNYMKKMIGTISFRKIM